MNGFRLQAACLRRGLLLLAGAVSFEAWAGESEHEQKRRAEQQVRMAKEAKETAVEQGWIEGVHAVELLRADLLYATLYAMEKEAGLIPAGSKPDPLAKSRSASSGSKPR